MKIFQCFSLNCKFKLAMIGLVTISMADVLASSDITPQHQEYIEIILSSADSLMTIINDILDLSKAEEGKLELDNVVFKLPNCIQNTVNSLKLRAREKQLDINLSMQSGIEEDLCGDPGRLRQVLTNLVGNAIKFTEVGTVDITVQQINKDLQEKEITLQFAIADSGIGISPEQLEKIFQPFVQADGTTTRKYGGTGLGLAISKKLVSLLQGKMWVESTVNKGSIFFFTAKFQIAPLAPTVDKHIDWQFFDDLSSLLVFENHHDHQITKKLTHNWKRIKPKVVYGREALLATLMQAKIRHKEFSAIIFEVPRLQPSLLTLVNEIRDKFDFNPFPPIIISVHSGSRGDLILCNEAKIAGYLVHPITDDDLLRTIQKTYAELRITGAIGQTITRHILRDSRSRISILMAEDNPVNQKLLVKLLEMRGYSLAISDNGKELLNKLADETKHYDVILMDVQMPEMGGIEATQLIRQMEQKGKKRIPIIALTAHASKEDRDRCIAAGMDQYLSKPVRATELYNAIENIFDNTQNVVVKPVIVETNYLPSEKIRPPQELLESVNGNKDLLIKIINTFSGYRKNALQEICLAIQQHDTLMLQRTAHSLKGVVAQFSDNRAFKLAERLEELGKAGVLEEAQNSYNQLELAVEEMTHELQQFKASLHS